MLDSIQKTPFRIRFGETAHFCQQLKHFEWHRVRIGPLSFLSCLPKERSESRHESLPNAKRSYFKARRS